MTDTVLAADRMDRTEAADPIDRIDATDPTLPAEKAEPTLPIERNEFFEAMDKMLPEDAMLKRLTLVDIG